MWLLKQFFIACFFIGCLAAIVAMASIADKTERTRCTRALGIATTGHDSVVYVASNPNCVRFLVEKQP